MAECSLWTRLAVDPKLHSLGSPFTRSRYIHRALWQRPEIHADLRRFLAAAGKFYHDLAQITGASVIIDSSKSPALAALLTQVPGIELHVVHLVRDLRGVVSSGRRTKAYVSATSARRCILQWYWANLGAELLQHRAAGFLRLRYEDFIVEPQPMLERIASALTGSPVRCSFLGDGHARIRSQHHALGNPDKFQCGEIPLRERKPELTPRPEQGCLSGRRPAARALRIFFDGTKIAFVPAFVPTCAFPPFGKLKSEPPQSGGRLVLAESLAESP